MSSAGATDDEKGLDALLKKLNLTHCPHCKTALTEANIGWNPHAQFEDVFPLVYVACKRCDKRLRRISVQAFATSRDDAIRKAHEGDVLS